MTGVHLHPAPRPGSICFVTDDLAGVVRNGGIGTHALLMAELLATSGWRVHVLYCGPVADPAELVATRRRLAAAGAVLTHLDELPAPPWAEIHSVGDGTDTLKASQRAFEAVELLHAEHRFDVIEFSDWRALGFRAVQAKRMGAAFADTRLAVKLHSPTAWQRQGNLRPRRSPWELLVEHCEQDAFEHADLQLSPSHAMVEDVRELGWTVRDDVAVAYPFPAPQGSPPDHAAPITELVFFGRLEPRKGLDVVLDALDGLPGQLPVLFLGHDTTIGGRTASEIITARLGDRPHRIETTLDREGALAELRRGGRLALLASRAESFGFTVAECVADEIPFLAADTGGIPEVVALAEARERWLFAPDAASLRAAVERRLAAPDEEERALRRAAARACDPVAWNARVAATYAELAARPLGPPRPALPDDPTVTVAVAHRDHPEYLPAALASLAAQTRAPDEVIVVDDGSTREESLAVFAEMEARYPAWRFLRQANAGPGAARNACLEQATSAWFLPFDADNVADPELVATLLRAVAAGGTDAAACHMLGFATDEDRAAGRHSFRFAPTGGPRLLTVLTNPFGDTCGLFRAEALRAVGGFETVRWSPHEDWETYTKLAFSGHHVDVVPRVLFAYRTGVGGRLDDLTADPAHVARLQRRMQRDVLGDARLSRHEQTQLLECLVGFAEPQRELEALHEAHGELSAWAYATIERVHAWRDDQLEGLRSFLTGKLEEAEARAERAEAAIGRRPLPPAAPSPTAPGARTAQRTPILYLAPWVDLGGSDKGTVDWFRTIDRERFEPSIITTQPSANRWLHLVEEHAEEVWVLPDVLSGAEIPLFVLDFIQSRGIRLVHLMNSRIGFDLLPDVAGLAEPPVVVVQLHAQEPDRSGYVRYAATRYGNLVTAFSVTSEALREELLGYDIPRSRTHVIPTGVDAAGEFDPERVAPYDDLGPGPHVLWPGRLTAQKDPMLTLDVLAELERRDVPLTLHVVGEGPLEATVRARAAAERLDHRIRWHPPSHEMPRWYRSCDVVLMTSAFEGVPYVLYEASAMGVPVVAPALPGNLELLGPNSANPLIAPRDAVGAYADAVERLLGDPALRRSLGDRARERMLRDHALETMGRRHGALYERLLDDRTLLPRAGRVTGPRPRPAGLPEPLRFDRGTPPARSVAVIVPCYEHGRFLPAALASIAAQTLPPARVVVVDDGSHDEETVAALDAAEADPLVTVIRLEHNCGPSTARNRGLELVRERYVLPLDADDLLLPTALEQMVEQLERAPEEVGFIYPNVRHVGNRNDEWSAPDYNLHLLLDNNSCPAPSLFDARIFEAGLRYDEDMVFGHEDWDLVLTLAEHRVEGRPAEGTTFLYRKRGFSRVDAVDFGPNSFVQVIKDRHPALYGRRDEIKARWAPAFSLVLVDADDAAWGPADVEALAAQTCKDFEVVAATADPLAGLGVRRAAEAGPGAAIEHARGRFVCVALPGAARAVRRKTFVEHLIRAFWAPVAKGPIVLGAGLPAVGAPMRQLTGAERRAAAPVGAAWERPPGFVAPSIEVGLTGDVVQDLLLAWEMSCAAVQWRQA